MRYCNCDEPGLIGRSGIETEWHLAREEGNSQRPNGKGGTVLVFDEIQKIPGWSEVVERLWDEDSREHRDLRVVILGSSPLLLPSGLTERFESTYVPHWSWEEMEAGFGWTLEQYVFYGEYPGAVPLVSDFSRWVRYVQQSLIEPTVSRDVLLMHRVDKPALLRQLFRLCCECSGQVLSYQKMLGHLQDAGNTTTLAHYLQLLSAAGMVTGLPKYSGSVVRRQASSPKVLARNTALFSATWGISLEEMKRDTLRWGLLVESAVGAHLVNLSIDRNVQVAYWREGDLEVDYVVSRGRSLAGLAVKIGDRAGPHRGLSAFGSLYPRARQALIGEAGTPLGDALCRSPDSWLR